MGRVLLWGAMLIIAGIAMLYAPWIIFVGEEPSQTVKTFQSIVNAKKICASDIELEGAVKFCWTIDVLEIVTYVIIGVGTVLLLVGIVAKK